MRLLFRGGRVIDTSERDGAAVVDEELDLLVEDGVITARGTDLGPADEIVECAGHWVIPGLVDMRARLGEPGYEYKEDIESATRAAAAGGISSVCALPDGKPMTDASAVCDLIARRAREINTVRVYPVAAVSRELAGQTLSEFGELKERGAIAVSSADDSVVDGGFMRRAMEYARTFGLPVFHCPQDPALREDGVMAEGALATRLGLRGWSALAESSMLARDLELVAATGARYHAGPLSCARSLELVESAKSKGLPVTASVAAHHLLLSEDACENYHPNAKLWPPLRHRDDQAALRRGVATGLIDAIVSNHTPQSAVEKDLEFDYAAFGAIGLQSLLSVVLTLVNKHGLERARVVHAVSAGPAAASGLSEKGAGSLVPGCPADVCVVDPAAEFVAGEGMQFSKSRNSPLFGMTLVGRAHSTWVGGRPIYRHGGST